MHTYREIMGPSGISRIEQIHAVVGRRRVMPTQPDYLIAKAEYGQPRIKVVAYTPPKPKPEPTAKALAERKLKETDSKIPRPLEDLYDLLIAKGVLVPEDLPGAVADLRAERKAARDILRAALKEESPVEEPPVEETPPVEGDQQ